jgi:hypothetical protein
VAVAIFVTVNFFLTWAWHLWFETRRQGRTPGKRMMKIRVIDARGLPVSLHQSLVRNITRVLDFLPAFYGVGAIAVLASSSRRRLGDIIADTLVVRDAQPLAYRGQLAAERRHNSLRTTKATINALEIPATYSPNMTSPCRLANPQTCRCGIKAAMMIPGAVRITFKQSSSCGNRNPVKDGVIFTCSRKPSQSNG